ncbi:MAG: NAD(P)/FAD-dependent oxidoreductase [Bacteroidales bacterium]|nr:NAD(P)/FAD-dependent oxidoreductase [Bacteroidales bacterium]
MQGRRIDIIGGGIAGLSLGIYLQKSGFQTTIYEKHSMPGGLCTGWRRGDYTFNGCVHWILGARKGISFHEFWKEIIDIDGVRFCEHLEKTQIELKEADRHGERYFHFINNIDDFESYLLDIAPEDSKMIRRWTDKVRMVMPLLEYLPPVKYSMKLIKLIKILPFMRSWGKMSNKEFAKHFKNSFLRSAIENLYDAEMRMSVIVFAQAYAAKGVALYPIGGSLAFTKCLQDEYIKQKGVLRTNCEVKDIIVENNKATGLRLKNGETTTADFVASAADWHWTVFDALGGRFASEKMLQLRNPSKESVFYSYCRLFIGVAKSMKEWPHFERFNIPTLCLPDGTTLQKLEVEVYNYDTTLAPEGKVTMAVNILTREGDWWIKLRTDDMAKYKETKMSIENAIIDVMTQHYGTEWRDSIEVTDFITPATFERYTANLRGSSQGWSPLTDITKRLPIKPTLPGLNNFIMCGHWLEAGGGIPVALYTARKAADKIKNRLKAD